MSCKLISMDVSTYSTGFAIYIDGELKDSGAIAFDKKDTEHYEKMKTSIIKLLKDEKPDIIAVEDPPYKKNPKTYKLMQRLVGCIEGFAINNDVYFEDFLPATWRKLVRDKNEIIPKKREELKQWSQEKTGVMQDDIADAILIGLAYIKKWTKKG